MTATPTLSPEELAKLLADAEEYFDLDRRPLPAVLDTACVRTGLHFQLSNGFPPKSVTTAQDGVVRLFMEYDTLTETSAHLPKFAKPQPCLSAGFPAGLRRQPDQLDDDRPGWRLHW
jgi:hypothetical protein